MVNGANLRLQKIREIQHRLNSQRASLSADSFRGGIENRRRKLAAAQKSIDDQIRGLAQEKFFIKRGRHAGSRSTGSVRSITDIPGFEGGIGARILADAKGTEDIRTGRRKVVREDASRTLAVTRPTSSGGKITVTRAGKVTERSKEGIVVGRGKITPLRARKFLSKEGAVVQSKIEFDRAQKEAGQSFAIPNQSFLRNISLTEGGEGAVIFEPEKIARPNQSVDFSQAKSSLPPKNSFRADAAEKNLEGVKKVIKRFTVTVRRATSQYRRLVKENTAFEINKLILTKKLFNLGFKVGTDYTGAFARGLGNLFEIHDLAKDVDVTRSVLQSIKLRETLSEIEQLNKKLIKKQKVQSLPLFELMKAQERKEIEKLIKIYVFRSEKLRAKNSPVIKRFKQLLLAPDTIFFLSTVGLLAGGAALAPLIGKVGTAVLFESIGGVQTTKQALRTLKEPTLENQLLLFLFAFPTGLSILKTLRKLGPRFKPSVRNVGESLKLFELEIVKNKLLLKEAKKQNNLRAIKKLEAWGARLDQAVKEHKYLLNNQGVIPVRQMNPVGHSIEFKRLTNSYKNQYHITTPNIKKAFKERLEVMDELKQFGKKTSLKREVVVDEKALKLLEEKLLKRGADLTNLPKGVLTVPGLPFSRKRKVNTELLKIFRTEDDVVLGGSAAQNLYLPKRYRRTPGDFDILSSDPSRVAKRIMARLAKKFPKSEVKIRQLPKAIRVSVDGVEYLDIGTLKTKVFVTISGLKVLPKKELFKKKLDSSIRRIRRMGLKDVEDLVRISEGNLGKADVLKKSPGKFLEVLPRKAEMGKDRLRFGETHFYWDYEAALGYARGEPYSIIKFPLSKISKFPTRLENLIKKAQNGKLSSSEQNRLRRALNRHMKANPDNFFLGPLTASSPIGEREWINSVFSRLFINDEYITFDSDLQRFVNIIEVGFSKKAKTNLFRKFYNSWKDKPFTQLKLRLGSTDVLTVRRYAKLLSRDMTGIVKSPNKKSFLEIFRKLLKRQKKEVIRKGLKGVKKPVVGIGGNSKISSKSPVLSSSKSSRIARRIISRRGVRRVSRGSVRKSLVRASRVSKKSVSESSRKSKRTVPKRTSSFSSGVLALPLNRVVKRILVRNTKRSSTRPSRRTSRVSKRTSSRKSVRPSRVSKRSSTRPSRRTSRITKRPARRPQRKPPRRPATRPPSKPPIRPPTKIIEKIIIIDPKKKKEEKLRRLVSFSLRKKKFIYLPDLYSLIFGVKANKSERAAFLKMGRRFTGLEGRKLVR